MLRFVLLFLLVALLSYSAGAEEGAGSTGETSDSSNTTVTTPSPTGGGRTNSSTEGGSQGDGKGSGQNNTAPTSETNVNSTSESPLALVYIDTVKPAPGSSLTTTVFKDNAFVGKFNSCRTTGEEPQRLYNISDCFRDSAYNDRLAFEATYKLPSSTVQKAFDDHPPSLKLLGSSSEFGSAAIRESSVQQADSTAMVHVLYNCDKLSNGIVSLMLTMQFTEANNSIVTILWTKQCVSGINTKIEFGYKIEDQAKGVTEHHPFNNESAPALVVVPSDKSTEVYAKVLEPGAQQEFLAPLVSSSDPSIVEVAVRGNHPKGGILRGLEAAAFQVSYECLTGKGSSQVSVSVAIPPFNNLTASWEKQCGGSVPRDLSIGSSEGSFDIVDHGKPTPKYMVGIGNIGTAHSAEHLHLPANQSKWTIYLTYGQPHPQGAVSKDASLHLGRVGVTVEHPGTIVSLAPKVSRKGPFGWNDDQNADNLIHIGDKIRITFRFVCRKAGESRLLFTLPLVHYDMLEFGIAKKCDHAEALPQHSKQWVLTAGNVFWMFIFVVVGVCVLYLMRTRSKGLKGFEPLPTAER